jgi:CelD/BcsL family acetyltransferase involved in cellulose biosynthesis
MQSRIITRFEELQDLAGEWDRLWSINPHRQIFKRFDWSRAWWQGYGRSVSLWTPVAFAGGKLVGVLPLVRYNNRLIFFGDPGSDYNDILCENATSPEILQCLLKALCNASPGAWKCATLANVPQRSLLLSSIAQLPSQWGSHFVKIEGQACSSVILDDENRQATLQGILSQKEPRQHEKKLQKLGKLNFRHIEDRAEIHCHLCKFFEQHTQRWALVSGGNQRFLSEQSRAFYGALVNNLDPSRELRFSVLQLDDRPIAYHFGFQLDGKFIHYKPTFDINLWQHSPGQVLTRRLFSYAETSGVNEFDFTIGNETYKYLLANNGNRNFTVRLFRPGLMSAVDRKFFLFRQRLAKDQPPAYTFLKAASGGIVSACESIHPAGLRKFLGEVVAAASRACHLPGEDLLLFSLKQGQEVHSRLKRTPLHGGNLVFSVGTLGDLANHSVNQPELLNPAKLQCARSRLKKGDVAYLTQTEGRLASLAWIGTRNELTGAEVGLNCQIPFEKPAAVIYDLWVAPDLRKQVTPNVLHTLASNIHEQGLDAWIFCKRKDIPLRQTIEDAGFSMRCRLRQTHYLSSDQPRTEGEVFPDSKRPASNMRSDVGLIQS